jgi:hypothetical protein
MSLSLCLLGRSVWKIVSNFFIAIYTNHHHHHHQGDAGGLKERGSSTRGTDGFRGREEEEFNIFFDQVTF